MGFRLSRDMVDENLSLATLAGNLPFSHSVLYFKDKGMGGNTKQNAEKKKWFPK